MKTHSSEVPVLHGVRGLAALMVFASHAANVCYGGAYLGNGGGQLGVMLFFVLSGYLMAMLYLPHTANLGQIRSFSVNRFARIYPMFALVVAVNYAASFYGLSLGTYGIRTAGDLLEHLFLIRGFSVFWTIGPEVVFYGIFLLLWMAKTKSTYAFAALLALFAVVSMIPGDPSRANSIASLHHRLPYFLVGTVLGAFHPRWSDARSALARAGFYASLLVFLACVPQLTSMAVALPDDINTDPSMAMWSHPFYLVVCGSVLVSAVTAAPWLMTNPVAVFMGKISFSFYLLHVLVLINIHALAPTHPALVIAGSLSLTTALSYTCHLAVERPCRMWIRNWFARAGASQRALNTAA